MKGNDVMERKKRDDNEGIMKAVSHFKTLL